MLSVNSQGNLISTVPREIINDPRVLPGGAEARGYFLKRGQFRVTYTTLEPEPDIPAPERASALLSQTSNKMMMVDTDEGPKRVFVYAANVRPGPLSADGEETLIITATFSVMDNPIWLVPALWALTAAIGTGGSWFLVDKVESFSSTSIGSILLVTVAAITGFVLFKTL